MPSASLCRNLPRRISTKSRKPSSAPGSCALYAGFMSEVHINSDAYEYVIHAGSKKDIPDPKDPEKALVHSQLINAATGHFIRDNMAHPVRPQHDSGTSTLRGFSAMLLAVAGLLI